MCTFFHAFQGFPGLIKCINLIPYRLRTASHNRPIHGFEMSLLADVDALDANLVVEDRVGWAVVVLTG
jgi:hypothetical protein